MNILIVNQPLRNRGDESAHRALIRSMLQAIPDAHICVLYYCEKADAVNQFVVKNERVKYVIEFNPYQHQLLAFDFLRKGLENSLFWLHPYVYKYLRHYRWADVVVCAPGGICMGGFMDSWHEEQLLIAMKLRKPIFYYGRSIGPFWDEPKEKKVFKQQAIRILNYASYVSLRDATSIKIAKDLGIDNVIETTDTAFLDYPQVEIPEEILREIDRKEYVVFVPNSLVWHYFYRGKATGGEVVTYWSKVASVIAKHYPNHKIVMLPQTSLQGKALDDKYLFQDIQKHCPGLDIFVSDDIYSSDIQQQIIRGADVVFGARYHSIVFAINNNVPFVSFSYEHKMSGLLDEIGLQDEMIDITQLFTSEGVDKSILEQLDELIPQIYRSAEGRIMAKEKAERAFLQFVNHISMLQR
ncbi:polysaccharide pyruvyl transferase family protein [Segatella oulorum]|uniref:polysaccharide pyruvyl transferase family protein n=1 Tax=Segatella oulorum TaxID=28136 RepID=UPI0023F3439C|nr:polysaccharide pyruvyl transferase family protein [Segatella oulorum]